MLQIGTKFEISVRKITGSVLIVIDIRHSLIKCRHWGGDQKLVGKMFIIGQDYSVETRERRERLTVVFEDAMGQKNIHVQGSIIWRLA